MLTILDYIERANTGEVLAERDFDLRMAKTLRNLYNQYKNRIHFDVNEVIPDDESADALFEAAVDLLSTVGMYHTETQRVISFTREEVLEIAATRPHQLILGTGKDQYVVRERTPESDFPLMNVGGAVGGPLTEDVFKLCNQSFAQEWTVDGILGGVLTSTQGLENISGKPNEMIVATKELVLSQQACADAGKPGLYIGCAPVGGVTADAIIAAITCSKLDPLRGQAPLQPLPESKFHWGHFKIAVFCKNYGMPVWNSGVATIGALARNPVEATIARLSSILGEVGLTNGESCTVWSTDVRGVTNARRNIWVNCAITRALDRNVGLPAYLLGYSFAGPCTEMSFQEIAAYTVAYTCCGGEMIWGGATANGVVTNMYAGLSSRMVGEMSRAVCGIPREKANEIVNMLYAKFEDKLSLSDAPKGKSFSECYNLDNLQPTIEFSDMYYKVKKEIAEECKIKFMY